MVEQRTENPRVGGSIPPPGTQSFLEFLIGGEQNSSVSVLILFSVPGLLTSPAKVRFTGFTVILFLGVDFWGNMRGRSGFCAETPCFRRKVLRFHSNTPPEDAIRRLPDEPLPRYLRLSANPKAVPKPL